MRDEIYEEDRPEGERFRNDGSSGKGSKNSATSTTVDYSDSRFGDVEADKEEALTENENLFSGMVNNTDQFYDDQINASKDWAEKQSQLQQEQTDFALEQIEQQKEQAQKDYTKEQSGAYADWQKQSNQYGTNAEQIASQGLKNTGYSESSQVGMYNTYQNRVSTAREAYSRAVQNYDNSMTQARLQNNAALAEIAYNALQQQLELALQGFQYENQLLLEQANRQLEIDNMYYTRWHDVLNQINTENSLAEQIRQFNESMALEREQFEWQKEQAAAASGGGGSGGGSGRGRDGDDDDDGSIDYTMAEVGRTMGALVDAGYSQEDALDYATTKRQDGTISTDEWKALKYLNLN